MQAHAETVIIKSYRHLLKRRTEKMRVKTYDGIVTLEAEKLADEFKPVRIEEVFVMIEDDGTHVMIEQAESVIIVTHKDNTKDYYLSFNDVEDYAYRKYIEIHPYYIKKNYRRIQDPLDECSWWMVEYLVMKGLLTHEDGPEDEMSEEDDGIPHLD